MKKQLYTEDELEIMRVDHNAQVFAGLNMQAVNPNDCSGCNYMNNPLYKAAPDLREALITLEQAFIVAVGDKSPFAKLALTPSRAAIAKAKGEGK